MRLDVTKAENNTAGCGGLIVLRTLRDLVAAPIEVVEESLVSIAITSEVSGFGTRLVEFLGVLDGLDNLGSVGCLG